MSQPVVTGYDPTLYHSHPQTAMLYAKNAGFVVQEEKSEDSTFHVSASREDMPGSLFTLTKIGGEEKWCWVRTSY